MIDAVIRDSITLGGVVLEGAGNKSSKSLAWELSLLVTSQVQDKKLQQKLLQTLHKISKGV
jgi:hypothetical protein